MLKAAADLIEVFIAGAESAGRTADLIELHMVPALGRIALALERERPAAARRAAAGDRRTSEARLAAARGADDPDRVIDCRDALTEHLRGEALHDLDQQVVRWLVSRVQARARAGTPAGATAAAALAARVVESFGDTPEGASLRAALPSLRRNAGLCPRCARPNPGGTALCPRCAGSGGTGPPARLTRVGGDPLSVRLKCRSCQTAFVIADDQAGGRVTCPKCGVQQVAPARPLHVPKPVAAAPPASRNRRRLSPPTAPVRPGRLRKLGLGVLMLLAVAAVAVAVAWPSLKHWWHPIPPDPVEAAAVAYLQALADGDYEAAHRLGTVDEPPAIRSFRDVHRQPEGDRAIKGSFAPLAALHARIDEKFAYDPAIGRFTPRDPLGPAAETLDALHDAKAKAEKDGLYKKMASGDPDDLFDAAEGLGGAMAKLAEGVLAPKKLIPTYKQLVLDAKPPLPADAAELALDFAAHRESWDCHAQAAVPDAEGRWPVPLRAHPGDRHRARPARLARRSADDAAADPGPVPARGDRHRMEGHLGPPPVGPGPSRRRSPNPSPRAQARAAVAGRSCPLRG